MAQHVAQKMAAVAVEKTFLYIAYVQSVSLKDYSRDLTVRLRWYIDEAHDCSKVFTLNPSARVDYCVFVVVPEVNDDTSITLSLSYDSYPGKSEHIAVNFLKLSSLCQSETFERKVIDLKNRDGVVATCDVQSARQQRWVRGKKPEVPRSAFFEDFTTDPQSKFLHDHITKEVRVSAR